MLMKNRNIISALIGLVGAVSNGGKTENTDYIIKTALMSEDTDEIVEQIREEKYVISPNCKSCASPCGNTSDYDMAKFDEEPQNIKQLKEKLIDELVSYAKSNDEIRPVTYKALAYIGYDLAEQSYLDLLEELRKAK